MFAITLAFVTLFFVPVTAFKQKNELIRFYWIGVWLFMAFIAAFAGGAETLKLLAYDATKWSEAMLAALTASFVVFVVFAWFRLSFKAIAAGVIYWWNKRIRA